MFAPDLLDPCVDVLAALAGDGQALEFAIGTGRVALSLGRFRAGPGVARIPPLPLTVMDELLARAWRLAGPLQGWLAWLLHPTFTGGVTGVVRADDGRLLLLRHRLWPEEQQWGFPGGLAKRGEQFTETVVREVREETGLTVRVGPLIAVRVGDRYRAEVYYEAALVGDLSGLVVQEREILEARLFAHDALPAAMPPLHREYAGRGRPA